MVALARAREPVSGRELARRASSSQQGAARILAGLVQAGVVRREERPPSALYQLNRGHVAAPLLEEMAALRAAVLERIKASAAEWDPMPVSLTVFGSIARGEGDERSDVDLLLVRPDGVALDDARWESQVADLERRVRTWTGNPARVAEYSVGELRAAAAERLPLLANVLQEGITLAGADLRAVTRTKRLRR